MRSLTFLMGLGLCALMGSTALAGDKVYSVEINKTQVLRLPSTASAVIIGNPKIADVSVHAVDTLFVVGRGFGETNLVVLDQEGNTMMDANIQVLHTTPHHGVRLFNGDVRESYSCAPYCSPSPVLGDDPAFIKNNTTKEKTVDPLTAFFNAAAASYENSDLSTSAPSRSGSVSRGDTNLSGGTN
ncbi:pilus assembly protein N-terminal domain-containing protein [Litorimonas sp. RW-G-Af-16]|uniref:pilus assembly protein N-terminal domain-containing protein n=1 Tax=Litorimonas sp. RW-G-Af-16 TaxID=3241168 RepID=UPI00390CBBFD